MIGAAAARSAARRRSKKAAIHDQQSKVRQQAALDIIKRYDVNSNMHIDKDGLTRMLSDANKNTPVTDDVLRWCRAVAHHTDGSAFSEGEFVEITYAGALAALDTFYAYQENEPTIVDLFQKYDKDKSGVLSTEELKHV
jgi:Ca2+-binding EF-hand superfamily protein